MKHIKCLLKLLGVPVLMVVMILITPVLFFLMTIDLTGCIDTEPLASKLISLPEWYKDL